ncbi:alpha-L-rhamnosidase-related protein [Puniceicoccus vermicola]|uniref:Sugar hydrolase n=1 Tax=Puniceicoccus vermicola TaxID=388746 RepID=A0A7X1E5E5_9BACT|nr:sugar hydrolase [Puniceicoccus vermicola]MBC2602943.1 sugar hydrolase [Puniceicoccus vermicola]
MAEDSKPKLFHKELEPKAIVRPVEISTAFQGCKMEVVEIFRSGELDICLGLDDEVIVDFGHHLVGYVEFSFHVNDQPTDSPYGIQFVFGEVPSEVAGDLEDYQGSLSRTWMQEERCTIDYPSGKFQLPRRYAFRYLKIRRIAGPKWHPLYVSAIRCRTVTSADFSRVFPLRGDDSELLNLDQVSLRTLGNCMQTVFEDGPKRDRRLWIGDLRLQALSNYMTFGQNHLVKRCLYLFAAVVNDRGQVPSSLFEFPTPHASNDYIVDYTALYPVILSEYFDATGDKETVRDLQEIAFYQLDVVLNHVDEEGLVHLPENQWSFIDWCDGLHKQAAMQGLFIFALNSCLRFAGKLRLSERVNQLELIRDKMISAAVKHFYGKEKTLWLSGPEGQVSFASWAWMTLAGVLPPEQSALSYKALWVEEGVVRPKGPYLYHYVVDALFQCGLENEALLLLKEYWGGMLAKDATTFWEVYSPEDDKLSPYKDYRVNSYCHAWSCTPSYFIRRDAVR